MPVFDQSGRKVGYQRVLSDLDEPMLSEIALRTGGEYFRADNAKELKKIYQSLAMRLAYDKEEPMEISALFVALGAMLTMVAALLSMWWYGRVL